MLQLMYGDNCRLFSSGSNNIVVVVMFLDLEMVRGEFVCGNLNSEYYKDFSKISIYFILGICYFYVISFRIKLVNNSS